MKNAAIVIIGVFFLAIPVLCAEIDGQWIGAMIGPDGKKLEFKYRLRVEGDVLIGLLESRFGVSVISEGKINGNKFEFTLQTGDVTVISRVCPQSRFSLELAA